MRITLSNTGQTISVTLDAEAYEALAKRAGNSGNFNISSDGNRLIFSKPEHVLSDREKKSKNRPLQYRQRIFSRLAGGMWFLTLTSKTFPNFPATGIVRFNALPFGSSADVVAFNVPADHAAPKGRARKPKAEAKYSLLSKMENLRKAWAARSAKAAERRAQKAELAVVVPVAEPEVRGAPAPQANLIITLPGREAKSFVVPAEDIVDFFYEAVDKGELVK